MSAQDIKMVKEFNSWRRGGDDVHADDKAYPKRLGDALDSVVAMAERTEEMDRERASLLGEIDRLRAYIQDAERYRYMRSNAVFQDRNGPGLYWYLPRWDRELPIGERLDRAIDAQTTPRCKKCGANMRPGQAIAQTFTGSPDFIGGQVCTVSPGGPGKLIECSKCPECGWSMTA